MHVVTVVGARPQFIKASAVSNVISEQRGIRETMVHTGQHFDGAMSDIFFKELSLKPPAYHLGIGGGLHGEMTGRMLGEIEKVLISESPDVVLIYGDTNSTLAAALAAAKLHIPIAHVEAGLRSFNMRMPEEINRVVADRVSTWLFAPTEAAHTHLRREGVQEEAIHVVGDVMYDVARRNGLVARQQGSLERLGLAAGDYVLATVHRAENTDHPRRLRAIVEALHLVGTERPVIWPMHPRTRSALKKEGLCQWDTGNVRIIDPVGYLEMVQLEQNAGVIATDSGGVQKEAFFYEVPCVTLRDETEWVELISSGWNRLAPPNDAATVAHAILSAFGTSGEDIKPYGLGDASERIVKELCGG